MTLTQLAKYLGCTELTARKICASRNLSIFKGTVCLSDSNLKSMVNDSIEQFKNGRGRKFINFEYADCMKLKTYFKTVKRYSYGTEYVLSSLSFEDWVGLEKPRFLYDGEIFIARHLCYDKDESVYLMQVQCVSMYTGKEYNFTIYSDMIELVNIINQQGKLI